LDIGINPRARVRRGGQKDRNGGEGGQRVKAAMFYSGGSLPWNYNIIAGPAGKCEVAQFLAIGQIRTTSGSVTVTRPGGISVAVKPGDLVYQGEVIETAADGAVGITFRDGTSFSLSNSARMVLDEFACDPKGAARSVLFSLARGTFAFIAGELARTGDLRIETPVASIRGRGQSGGIGILTLAALTFSVVQESLAANPDDAAPDEDPITIKDLLHGTFTLAIKDATGAPTGQVVTVDNPEETVRIRDAEAGIQLSPAEESY
jgi:hypothetical protein